MNWDYEFQITKPKAFWLAVIMTYSILASAFRIWDWSMQPEEVVHTSVKRRHQNSTGFNAFSASLPQKYTKNRIQTYSQSYTHLLHFPQGAWSLDRCYSATWDHRRVWSRDKKHPRAHSSGWGSCVKDLLYCMFSVTEKNHLTHQQHVKQEKSHFQRWKKNKKKQQKEDLITT